MVTVVWVVGLERMVFGGNCAIECGSGTEYVGWQLCCGLWVLNRLCWMVTVLWCVGLEQIVLSGFCALGFGSGTDFV
jgi:hypothetical protein